jgi:hypothetical protein
LGTEDRPRDLDGSSQSVLDFRQVSREQVGGSPVVGTEAYSNLSNVPSTESFLVPMAKVVGDDAAVHLMARKAIVSGQ